MSFFGATRAALAAGQHVVCPRFVEFEFASGTERVWEGTGLIFADGATWKGAGEIGSIGDAVFGVGDQAGNITYRLSGVAPAVAAAAQAEFATEVRGRDVTLYGRFLNATTLQPLDTRFTLRQDIMDSISYSASGPGLRSITLTAETIWTNRNAAAFAYYTDRDQQARFPGDVGLEFMPQMKNKRVVWPDVDAF